MSVVCRSFVGWGADIENGCSARDLGEIRSFVGFVGCLERKNREKGEIVHSDTEQEKTERRGVKTADKADKGIREKNKTLLITRFFPFFDLMEGSRQTADKQPTKPTNGAG